MSTFSKSIFFQVSSFTPLYFPLAWNADLDISPVSSPPSSTNWNNDGIPVASPKNKIHKPVPPVNHMPKNGVYCESANIKLISYLIVTANTIDLLRIFCAGFSPTISPSASTAMRRHGNPPVPSIAPPNKGYNSPALSPSISFHKYQHTRNKRTSPAPASSYLISPPPSKQQGVISCAVVPNTFLIYTNIIFGLSHPFNVQLQYLYRSSHLSSISSWKKAKALCSCTPSFWYQNIYSKC